MPHVPIRGVDHYYEWITAEPSAATPHSTASKPVLVFLHGWAGSARYWASTAQALTDQFDCLLYDLRGFGRSRLPRPLPEAVLELGYELESYADDLALLLEMFNLKRVYLNAHSTGASIATLFLNRYSDRVERAVLTCNGVFEYDEKAFKAFHQFGGYVVMFRPAWFLRIPALEHLFMARFLRRPIARAAKRAFLKDFVEADYEAALGTIFTAVCQKAAEEMPLEFARLTVPTLLVSGEYDQIISAEMGRQAARLNDRIEHVILPETGHFPMLEDPDAYLSLVRDFLRVPNAVS